MEILLPIIATILVLFLIAKLLELTKQNSTLMSQMTSIHKDLEMKMTAGNTQFDRKFEATTSNLFHITKHLTDLETSSRHIKELRDELTSLGSILSSPKLRGNLGELLLEDLLKNYFPKNRYAREFPFRNGTKVDACIFLENNYKLCIDAKFPLENYKRSLEEKDSTASILAFKRDVKKHISDISSKYILQEEKTLGFALMYIPSETMYYEIISRKELDEIMTFAYEKGVLPVSPSTLFSYIQILLLGFKGLQIEEHAEKILVAMEQLETTLGRFGESYDKLGKHLHNAEATFDESRRLFDKVQMVSENIKSIEPEKKEPLKELTESNIEIEK